MKVRLVFIVLLVYCMNCEVASSDIHFLEQGEIYKYNWIVAGRDISSLQIYCYRGKPKYIIHLWQTVSLLLDLKNDNYVQYDGHTPQEIVNKQKEHKSSWSLNLFAWKQKYFRLDPFNQSCIGIDTYDSYEVHLNVIRIDYWKAFALLIGILLFYSAERLSQNTFFYYVCGVTVGVSASFLILIYFISKLFPRKPMMYGVAICGWTVGVYILQLLFDNVRVIVLGYQNYVIWYICITGLISLIVCYRWGPVTNKRTKNLIKWTLQSAAVVSVFFSSEFQEAAMGFIILIILTYNFPKKWVSVSQAYWKRKFPPKVKLLSNDEYYQEGVRETTKALKELRDYCSSPDCNQWKTVLKLKDVKRFASFIEGTSHLSDEEIVDYESSLHEVEISDDEEDNSFTD